MSEDQQTYTAFAGYELVASGPLADVLKAVKRFLDQRDGVQLLIFEDRTGRQADFDLRGTIEQVLVRAMPPKTAAGPGRPKLGVVSREVSLLPRHWEWLEQQPNGASAALRRLVDEARNRNPERQRVRQATDATYRFMSVMAGNLPGFEEASRALYAEDRLRFDDLIRDWPVDIRTHTERLADAVFREG